MNPVDDSRVRRGQDQRLSLRKSSVFFSSLIAMAAGSEVIVVRLSLESGANERCEVGVEEGGRKVANLEPVGVRREPVSVTS